MIKDIIYIILITFLPFLELRASIPYGLLATDLGWPLVFSICVLTNMILGPIIYFFCDKVVHIFLHIKPFARIWHRTIERSQKKIHKFMERYGWLGVALFIGIPLPGSGSYSGALGSYVLGLGYKKFIIANILGVFIAGVIVTLVVLTGNGAWSLFIKSI